MLASQRLECFSFWFFFSFKWEKYENSKDLWEIHSWNNVPNASLANGFTVIPWFSDDSFGFWTFFCIYRAMNIFTTNSNEMKNGFWNLWNVFVKRDFFVIFFRLLRRAIFREQQCNMAAIVNKKINQIFFEKLDLVHEFILYFNAFKLEHDGKWTNRVN